MTPGIHPQRVNKKVITKEPHPLSMTESGGNNMASSTLKYALFKNLLYSFDEYLLILLH